jgi:large subunit ribosomal protein L21
MSYAIIENGGKQYKVIEGTPIEVDLLPLEIGKQIKLDKVLLVSDETGIRVGTPLLKEVSVDATVLAHFKGPKITIFKYRPKERYRIKTGHRQQFTRLMVDSIVFPGKPKTTKQEVSKPVEILVKNEKVNAKSVKKTDKKVVTSKKKVTTKNQK